jgi:hypothetical protein
MTEEEWRKTQTAQAVVAFLAVSLSVAINYLGGELGGVFTRIAATMAKANIEEQIEQAGLPPFLKGLVDPDRDDAMRAGMYLTAILSALEACIEDITKAAIEADRTITEGREYERLRLSATGLFSTDEEKIQALYQAIEESVGLKSGANRYEDILKFVQLDGAVPGIVRDYLYNAQLIRNVWAHSAGTADAKFVKQAPHLRWAQGDLVKLTLEETRDYLSAVLLYGMIVTNRCREKCGLAPSQAGEKMAATPLGAAYVAMYPSLQGDSESQTTEPRTDTVPEGT